MPTPQIMIYNQGDQNCPDLECRNCGKISKSDFCSQECHENFLT